MLLISRRRRRLSGIVDCLRRTLRNCLWARPSMEAHAVGTGGDLRRTQGWPLAGNALLRQQLVVLRRGVKRPAAMPADRALLVLLAGRVRAWRRARLQQLREATPYRTTTACSGRAMLECDGGSSAPPVGR